MLKTFSNKCYNFSTNAFSILSLIFTGILVLSGFVYTCYSLDMETQQVLTRPDSPLANLLGILCAALLLGFALKLTSKNPSLGKKLLLAGTILWILAVSAVLIIFSKTVPAADAYSVYEIASFLAKGDTSVIHPTASYLSYYPQQIGLVAFYEPLLRLWYCVFPQIPAYHFLKIVYALLGVVIFYFQYLTVHHLFKNDRTDVIFILFSAANLPFLMYLSFVYGEIPSFAAASIGIYCFYRLLCSLREKRTRKTLFFFFLALLFLTFSVQLRKNSLILIIAVVMIAFLQWIKERRHLLLVFALLCAICSVSILPLIQTGYELRAGNTLKSGVPASSYFAMGMQESSRGYGWYNGFNFNTYQESGMNTDTTNEISSLAIKERLNDFKEHPDYAADFYLGKFLSQWADGTYACRQATLATFGGRQSFFVQLYEGSYSIYLIEYCNIFQNILYLGAFLFCLGNCKKKIETAVKGLPLYLGLVVVFGGFLFHMIWEANSRYIFLYEMLMLPYAAAGMEWLLHSADTICRNRSNRSTNCS